jgi:hypothetical protein
MNNNKFWFLLHSSLYADYSTRTILFVLDTPHNKIKQGYSTIYILVKHHSHKLFTALKTMVYKSRLYYKLSKQSLQ